jgi:RNA polymerase sigma factor (TIGR02999 family)
MSSPSEITDLLVDWSKGDKAALDRLIPMVERELRRLAHSYMRRENKDHTLQTTALVNEAYLKLVDQKSTHWKSRAHFFAIAATIMRRILLNHARDRDRQKRGGNAIQVSLSDLAIMSDQRSEELIALDEALLKLATIDERKSQVIELHYFGGLTIEEMAHVLEVSSATINRDLHLAKAWLTLELTNGS